MPTYRYQCDCGGFEIWQPMAADALTTHEGCAGLPRRVLGPVRTYSVGSAGAETRRVDATERTWDKDRPAYKRLRMNGMQPPHVDGCAMLESRADNDLEVNTGLKYGKINERPVKEAVTMAKESGWIPTRVSA